MLWNDEYAQLKQHLSGLTPPTLLAFSVALGQQIVSVLRSLF